MSRHKRPPQPLPYKLTTRDIDVLKSVYQHRFLTTAHVHTLHFHPSSLRVAQVRLQRMWTGHVLDRTYLMPEIPDVRDRYVEQPLYSIAARGALHLEDVIGKSMWDIPHTKAQNQRGYRTIRHNLVFTDLAIAFEAFARRMPEWSVVATREDALRSALAKRGDQAGGIVADGAITLTHAGFRTPQTLVVEVVRAGVKAGNDSIRRKMERYRKALRSGFFRDVNGFEWVRNVIFLTTSADRAKHFADLARDIPGAENLFRFGVYESRESNRFAPNNLLTPDRLPDPVLTTPSGQRTSFFPSFQSGSPTAGPV